MYLPFADSVILADGSRTRPLPPKKAEAPELDCVSLYAEWTGIDRELSLPAKAFLAKGLPQALSLLYYLVYCKYFNVLSSAFRIAREVNNKPGGRNVLQSYDEFLNPANHFEILTDSTSAVASYLIPPPGSFPKASAKLHPFPQPTKLFRQKIQENFDESAQTLDTQPNKNML